MWKWSICKADNKNHGKRKSEVGNVFNVFVLPATAARGLAMAHRLASCCYNLVWLLATKEKKESQRPADWDSSLQQ